MTLSAPRILRLARFGAGLISGSTGSAGLLLTRRCDMNCSYCAVRQSREGAVSELPLERWKSIVDALHTLGMRQLVLTGGEPTLYPHAAELARYARPRMLVSMVSNGRRLVSNLNAYDDLLENIDLLSLSADYFFDAHAEPLAEKIERMRARVDSAGLNREMIVTLTAENVEQAPRFARALGAAGFSIRFSMVHPCESASGYRFRSQNSDAGAHAPSPDSLDRMVHELLRDRRLSRYLLDSPEFLTGMPAFLRGETTNSCPAGVRTLEVDADGQTQACQDSPPCGLTPEQLAALPDPERFVRQTRLPGCRCHYSHYFRHGGFGIGITAALHRLKGLASR